MISNSERPLEIPTAIINDEHHLQGALSDSQREEHLGSMTQYTTHQQPPERLEIPAPESIAAVVQLQGGESKITISGSGPSSTLGAPVEKTAISHDLPHEPLPTSHVPTHGHTTSQKSLPFKLGTTGESNSVAGPFSLASHVNTDGQSSRNCLLKGRL
jgi:hypothetical protein